MKLTIFAVLALGHLVMANNDPSTFSAKRVIGNIVSAMKNAFEASPHIVGGKEVSPNSHPYQAVLLSEQRDKNFSMCGGSLISTEWILTAAHCTEDVKHMVAFVGAHNLLEEEPHRQTLKVSKIERQNWNKMRHTNDIALIKLATPAILDENFVQTIRLPSVALRSRSLTDTPIEMTGWGRTSDIVKETSSRLRSAQSTVIDHYMCNFLLGGGIKSSMICADGSEGRSVCNGDSGGPMVMTEYDGEKTVIGVAAFVTMFGCEEGFPSVFTRVDRYLGWIHHHTGILLRLK